MSITMFEIIARFTRKVRFPGRERLLRSFFPPQSFRDSDSVHEFIVDYDNNLLFRCDLGSYIEWNIYFKGYYAPDLSLVIKKLIKPGMQVIDVGANVGVYTLLAAKRTGETGRVVSFEPNPEVFQRLQYNVSLNKFEKKVNIKPIALSNIKGEFTLFVPRADYVHRGISSLQKYSSALEAKEKVNVMMLDEIWNDLELAQLDFLKIDTDGSDALVIDGAMEIIVRYRPIIIFEANYLAHQKADAAMEKVHQKFIELGYQLFTAGYFGLLNRCPTDQPLPDTNIICIPSNK